VIICLHLQVALTAVKDSMGAVSYVEFVLHPAPMFETFVEVADRVLEAIQPAGGAAASEPPQQVRLWGRTCISSLCCAVLAWGRPLHVAQRKGARAPQVLSQVTSFWFLRPTTCLLP
jgi:hypothetical protein